MSRLSEDLRRRKGGSPWLAIALAGAVVAAALALLAVSSSGPTAHEKAKKRQHDALSEDYERAKGAPPSDASRALLNPYAPD